ncbi:MAG: hypothetical protein RBU45_07925 [Myxococcota bacterium]|jgi:hypothetical protein|nr:hypothetical protein [Myxococcota bacterium]
MADSFDEQGSGGEVPGPLTEHRIQIRLLPDQQVRVKEVTGVELEILDMADPFATLSMVMPQLRPEDIEIMAIRHVRAQQQAEAVQRDALLALAAYQDDEAQRLAEAEQQRLAMEEWNAQQQQQVMMAMAAGATMTYGGGEDEEAPAELAAEEPAEAEPVAKPSKKGQRKGVRSAARKKQATEKYFFQEED